MLGQRGDGRLFVLEQSGNVKLVHNDGTNFTALHLSVDSAGEPRALVDGDTELLRDFVQSSGIAVDRLLKERASSLPEAR